ncbi:hypothetical protein GGH13_002078 [Coemansia sp. S155-1]|nr:hypothetical protein GGH13_002078 [Coemansia sp. S155-1]
MIHCFVGLGALAYTWVSGITLFKSAVQGVQDGASAIEAATGAIQSITGAIEAATSAILAIAKTGRQRCRRCPGGGQSDEGHAGAARPVVTSSSICWRMSLSYRGYWRSPLPRHWSCRRTRNWSRLWHNHSKPHLGSSYSFSTCQGVRYRPSAACYKSSSDGRCPSNSARCQSSSKARRRSSSKALLPIKRRPLSVL